MITVHQQQKTVKTIVPFMLTLKLMHIIIFISLVLSYTLLLQHYYFYTALNH